MIFLGNLIEENNKTRVGLIHTMPFDKENGFSKTEEELQTMGILVDSLPEKIEKEGKECILYCNSSNKELWYEYIDIKKTQEQIQEENMEGVQKQLFETQTELLLAKSENQRLGQQLFNLETNLTEKGVI